MMREKKNIGLLMAVLALVFVAATALAAATIGTPTIVPAGDGVDAQGTVTFSGGHKTLCIRLDSGHSSGPSALEYECDSFPAQNSSGNYSCNIPSSEIGGSAIAYSIIAYTAASGCTGDAVEQGPNQYDPTAVSLADFTAQNSAFNLWPVALGLLALLGVAVYVVRRVAVYNT